MYACKESQTNTLNVLLNDIKCLGQMNAVSTELDMSPLMNAVYDGCRRDIVPLLLKKGADPNLENSEGVTALMVAVGGNPCQKLEGEDGDLWIRLSVWNLLLFCFGMAQK